jgi:hypothetical protein
MRKPYRAQTDWGITSANTTIMAVEATTAWIPPPNTDSAMTGRASLNYFPGETDGQLCATALKAKQGDWTHDHVRNEKSDEQEVTILAERKNFGCPELLLFRS